MLFSLLVRFSASFSFPLLFFLSPTSCFWLYLSYPLFDGSTVMGIFVPHAGGAVPVFLFFFSWGYVLARHHGKPEHSRKK